MARHSLIGELFEFLKHNKKWWLAPVLIVFLLLSGLIVGLLISIFQSVTQIQEITLTFVPKIIVVFLAFVIFLPWMGDTLLNFVVPLLQDMDRVAR